MINYRILISINYGDTCKSRAAHQRFFTVGVGCCYMKIDCLNDEKKVAIYGFKRHR